MSSDWIAAGDGYQVEIRRNEDKSIDEVVLYHHEEEGDVCLFHMEQSSKSAWYFGVGHNAPVQFNVFRDKKKVVVKWYEDD